MKAQPLAAKTIQQQPADAKPQRVTAGEHHDLQSLLDGLLQVANQQCRLIRAYQNPGWHHPCTLTRR